MKGSSEIDPRNVKLDLDPHYMKFDDVQDKEPLVFNKHSSYVRTFGAKELEDNLKTHVIRPQPIGWSRHVEITTPGLGNHEATIRIPWKIWIQRVLGIGYKNVLVMTRSDCDGSNEGRFVTLDGLEATEEMQFAEDGPEETKEGASALEDGPEDKSTSSLVVPGTGTQT